MTQPTEILNSAHRALRTRSAGRDKADGEKTMATCVRLYNELYGADMTEEQGWTFMELLKLVRSARGEFVLDDYVDRAGYAALAGEAGARERSGSHQQDLGTDSTEPGEQESGDHEEESEPE